MRHCTSHISCDRGALTGNLVLFLVDSCIPARQWTDTWLDLATSHRQTWLFSSTSMYHSTDLLTVRGVAHLVVHGTSGSTSYETIPPVRLESSGDVLSTADMVVQRRDGPCRLCEIDDDDDDEWTDNTRCSILSRFSHFHVSHFPPLQGGGGLRGIHIFLYIIGKCIIHFSEQGSRLE